MRSKLSQRWLVLLLLALTLALAACGGVSVTPTDGSPPADDGVTTMPSDGQGQTPAWLGQLVRSMERAPVTDPPRAVFAYLYQGETVYYVPAPCCDFFSDLYDAGGQLIGHPDGGIAGGGDGTAPDFFESRTGELLVWQDERSVEPGTVLTPAPIESVEVLVLESFPPQFNVAVVSGLPNGCASYAGYHLLVSGQTVTIELLNWVPSPDRDVFCTMQYGTVRTFIPLGSDFARGVVYTVDVNRTTVTFEGGA